MSAETGGLAARWSPPSDGTGGETLALRFAGRSKHGPAVPPLKGPLGYSKGPPDGGVRELKSWRRAFCPPPGRHAASRGSGAAWPGVAPRALLLEAESYREGL